MNYPLMTFLLATLPGLACAASPGEAVYNRVCIACHQAGGEGAPGLAPKLAGTFSQRLAKPAGRDYLGQVLFTGLSGRIEVDGESYNSVMPPQAPALSDQELADVLNHVAQTLNTAPAGFKPYSAEEMKTHRCVSANMTSTRALRQKSVGQP